MTRPAPTLHPRHPDLVQCACGVAWIDPSYARCTRCEADVDTDTHNPQEDPCNTSRPISTGSKPSTSMSR